MRGVETRVARQGGRGRSGTSDMAGGVGKEVKGAVKKAASGKKGSAGGSSGKKGKSSGGSGSGADKAKRAAKEFLK